MFSVRLSDVWYTTSFRLALLFAGLFSAASLLLFGFIYWRTIDYVSGEVDSWLSRETAGSIVMPAADLERRLNARVAAQPDGRRPITLFGSNGKWLAGNRETLPSPLSPDDQPFRLTLQRGGEAAPFRAMVHRLPASEILLIARDMRDIDQFREVLLGALLSGGAVALLLGLIGAAIIGAGTLGHIDGVTRTIERIVNGDLSQRLPSDGRGGDIDRLIQVVNRMLDEIERLMQEVKGVTEDIAHDLRTPLTRLLAGLERVRRRAASPTAYDAAIDDAIIETKGILVTFSALLRIAEVESGARRVGFGTLDLNAVAADVGELYDPVAEAKRISLLLEPSAKGTAETAGDPSLLFEALSNLVDNAIKYSPSDSRVTLRVFDTRDRIGLEVSDTGPGIPQREREAVLRRFHRVEKSRSAPGNGLGLSLVAAVAKLHDLHLAIEDASPGCRVVLWCNRQTQSERKSARLDHQTEPV